MAVARSQTLSIRRLYRRWRRQAYRQAHFGFAVLLTIVVLAYAGVPHVARFVESVGGYNPGHYEPKDQAREAWLQRPDDPDAVLSQIPWNTVINIGLFLVVALVWMTLVPSRSAPSAAAPLSEPRTYRLVLAYDGTAFHGWQVQPDARTVQGTLLAAAGTAVLGRGPRGRRQSHRRRRPRAAPDRRADRDLGARSAARCRPPSTPTCPERSGWWRPREAARAFDARRSAFGKRYAYLIDNGPVASPLLLRYAWHVPGGLDLPPCARRWPRCGARHDFSAFCAAPGRQASPLCRVRAIHVLGRHGRLALLISADRFLHHMVRNIVGSAVEVGRGAREPGWLAEVLASRDRTRAGPTAPAHGPDARARPLLLESSTRHACVSPWLSRTSEKPGSISCNGGPRSRASPSVATSSRAGLAGRRRGHWGSRCAARPAATPGNAEFR